jgi:hypothetical protein
MIVGYDKEGNKIVDSNYRLLRRYEENDHIIELADISGNLILAISNQIQFVEGPYEQHYNQRMFTEPASYFEPSNALILGGGDGLGARNLQQLGITDITVVDISSKIVDYAKNYKRLVTLNKNSLNHRDIKIVIGDAYDFCLKEAESNNKYDIIFLDYPVDYEYAINMMEKVAGKYFVPEEVKKTSKSTGKINTHDHLLHTSMISANLVTKDARIILNDFSYIKDIRSIYDNVLNTTFEVNKFSYEDEHNILPRRSSLSLTVASKNKLRSKIWLRNQ